jgi:hypothetical protein
MRTLLCVPNCYWECPTVFEETRSLSQARSVTALTNDPYSMDCPVSSRAPAPVLGASDCRASGGGFAVRLARQDLEHAPTADA